MIIIRGFHFSGLEFIVEKKDARLVLDKVRVKMTMMLIMIQAQVINDHIRAQTQLPFCFVIGSEGSRTFRDIGDKYDADAGDILVVMDPCSGDWMGWPCRNLLYLLSKKHKTVRG